MAVTSESEDWATLTADLREQLVHFLPLDSKGLLSSLDELSVYDQRRIHSHLEHLCNAFGAMVPRWIADSIDDPDAKHFHAAEATLLFADVTGFTPLTAQLEAFGRIGNEYITSALNQFFAAVVPIALAYNGDLLAFGGDAILCAFDRVDYAAAAAWEMQQAIALLDLQDLNLPCSLNLQMKVGIASGPLVLTNVSIDNRRVALPLGSVLDTTDAMANATAPGQIRLDAHAAAGARLVAQLAPQSDGSMLLVGLNDRLPLPEKRHVHTDSVCISELVGRVVALARYLPQSVVASLIAAPQAMPGYGEQRHVVNLFSNLVGLHALADMLWSDAPELIAQIADLVVSRAITLIEGHGGALARVDIYPGGHKLLALFGAPVAHEREAERAILAALALRNAMAKLNIQIQILLGERMNATTTAFSTGQVALTLRSGINAGPVVAGLVGSPVRWEYTVMGDAVNVGARLMSKAQPGEVLVGSSVSEMVPSILDAEARTLLLKGKREPMSVLSVQALRSANLSALPQDPPLVGRENERQTLHRIGEVLRAGKPAVVFIQGEAGIGKSRLVRELPVILGSDVTCVQTGSPGLVRVSFGVFRTLLAELCQRVLGSATPLDNDQLRLAIERLCPGRSAELWPALAVLLGVADADSASFGVTAETRQRMMAWAVQSVLEGAAAREAIACICEDLHDADDASLAVLEQLLTIGWRAPVLLCATLRSAAGTNQIARRLLEAATRQFQSGATSIEIGGLSFDGGSMLLDSLLPSLAPETRAMLHAHTTGNPLFLQVLAQTVQQQRLLMQSSQGLMLRGSLSSLDIPRTLRELMAAQVDRLPAEVRRLAQVAAVIAVADRTVPLWLLEQLVGEHQAVEPRMLALEQAQVIVAEISQSIPRYTFRHALYQQAAYDQLLERERRELHRRAGLVLQDHLDRQEARVEALAYHCYEGKLWELAADYSLEAGQRALRAYANRDARRYLRRALGLARRLERVEQEADAREGLGELYTLIGRYRPAQAQIERALRYSKTVSHDSAQIEAQVRRYRLLVVVGDRTGSYTQAELDCRTGLALVQKSLPQSIEGPRLYAQLGVIMMRRGEYLQAEQVCHQGLSLLPASSEVLHEHVELLQLLGTIAGLRSNYSQAIAMLRESLPLARTTGDPYLIAPMLRDLGVFYFSMGDREQALVFYRESLQVDERTGDMFGRLRGLGHLGLLHMIYGEYDIALVYYQECFQLATNLNLPDISANIAINLGQLAYFQGDLDYAYSYLLRGYTIASEHGDGRHTTDSLYRLGDVVLAQGRWDEGLHYGHQALRFAHRIANDGYVASALRVIGEAYTGMGRLAEAASYLEEAQAVQAHVDDPYDQVLLSVATARLALLRGERARAIDHSAAAEQLAQRHGFTFPLQKAQQIRQDIGAQWPSPSA